MRIAFAILFLSFYFQYNLGVSRSEEIIYNDYGGYIYQYNARLNHFKQAKTHVVIAGNCYSACTRFMSAPNVCAKPGAYFYFHGAYDAKKSERKPEARTSMLDSMASETPEAFALQNRYKVWWFGLVRSKTPPKDTHIDADIDIIHEMVKEGLYQKWLRVRAVRLVRSC